MQGQYPDRRLREGLVLRGYGVGGAAGFAALLGQLPIINLLRAVRICLHSLLYLLPFAASHWGNSSSFSRTMATGLGQASQQGCFLARVTLRDLLLCVQVWTFQILGSGFYEEGRRWSLGSHPHCHLVIPQTGKEPGIPGPLLHCSGAGIPGCSGKGLTGWQVTFLGLAPALYFVL